MLLRPVGCNLSTVDLRLSGSQLPTAACHLRASSYAARSKVQLHVLRSAAPLNCRDHSSLGATLP